MAITAVLSVDESSVPSGKTANFILAIKNSGAAALNITSVVASPTQAAGVPALLGQPTFPPAATVQVLAGATLKVPFSGTFFALPQASGAQPQQSAVGVRATVVMSDGSNVSSDTVTMQVQPTTEPPTQPPVPGQFDFTSNNNSALWALGFLNP